MRAWGNCTGGASIRGNSIGGAAADEGRGGRSFAPLAGRDLESEDEVFAGGPRNCEDSNAEFRMKNAGAGNHEGCPKLRPACGERGHLLQVLRPACGEKVPRS